MMQDIKTEGIVYEVDSTYIDEVAKVVDKQIKASCPPGYRFLTCVGSTIESKFGKIKGASILVFEKDTNSNENIIPSKAK